MERADGQRGSEKICQRDGHKRKGKGKGSREVFKNIEGVKTMNVGTWSSAGVAEKSEAYGKPWTVVEVIVIYHE